LNLNQFITVTVSHVSSISYAVTSLDKQNRLRETSKSDNSAWEIYVICPFRYLNHFEFIKFCGKKKTTNRGKLI